MKSDSLKGKTLGVISTMLTLVVSLITCVMYIVTSYYLYYFLAVTSLFLGVTNLLFMALEFDDMLSKLPKREKKKKKKKAKRAKHKQEEEEHPVETVTEEKVHKKHRINIHLIAKTICFAIYIVVFYLCNTTIFTFMKTMKESPKPVAVNAVFLLIVFVIVIVLDRLCKYAES